MTRSDGGAIGFAGGAVYSDGGAIGFAGGAVRGPSGIAEGAPPLTPCASGALRPTLGTWPGLAPGNDRLF